MSKKTFRDFAKTVKRGMFLIVYPEGTSTDGRHGVLPFKSTVFESAIAAETPIIPMVTSYRVPKGGPEVCWYGDMTLLPHMWNLLGAPYIEARLHFLKPIFPRGMSRKELALFVHDTMEREYLARFSA
jgi:1-acyl-sn-glycerol-3-phosphate acyltransferase